MATFTAADLANMRAKREQRIAAAKAQAKGEKVEYLLTENLAGKSTLWWPTKPVELVGRIVDFMVTKENNIGGNAVGDFVGVREYKTHRTPNGKIIVCPQEYGRTCKCCEAYNEHYEEAKADRKHWAHKFRASRVALFNMIVRKEVNGKIGYAPYVIRASKFFTTTKINEKLEVKEKLSPGKASEIYAFSDLEIGYWFGLTFAEAPAVAGNKDEYMQIVDVNPLLDEPRKMIPESLFPHITDLDLLIPDSPTDAEIDDFFGFDKEKAKTTSNSDELDCGIAGSKVDAVQAEEDDVIIGDEDGGGDVESIVGATQVEDEPEKPKAAPSKSKATAKSKPAGKEKPEPTSTPVEVVEEPASEEQPDVLDLDAESTDPDLDDFDVFGDGFED